MLRKDFEDKRFTAALKGVTLDDPFEESQKSKMEEIKERARARIAGSKTAVEKQDFAAMGINFVVEDE